MITLLVLASTYNPALPFPKLEELGWQDKDTQHDAGTDPISQILLQERPLDGALMKYCSALCQTVVAHGASDPQHPQGADSVPLHWEKEAEIFPDNGESQGFEEAGVDVRPTPSQFQPPPQGVLMQSHSGSPTSHTRVDMGSFEWCFSTRTLLFWQKCGQGLG